jgi:hypothetical protein
MARFTSLLLAVAVISLGCGEAKPRVSGSVTYNGQPVADGYVTFRPTGSGTSFAAQITGGKYVADTVYPGQYQAVVTASEDAPVPKSREDAASRRSAPASAAPAIPDDAQGNNQTVEITAGEQTLDFTLTSP